MKRITLFLLLINAWPLYAMNFERIGDVQVGFDTTDKTLRAWNEQETDNGEHIVLTSVSRKINSPECTAYAIQSDSEKNPKKTRIKKRVDPDQDTVGRLKAAIDLYVKKKMTEAFN
jgi:hypothetical protein